MLGIDIVSNVRIKRAIERFGERFIKKVYTQNEVDYCKKRKDFYRCLSARWACKEAVFKAFYQEFGIPLRFSHIEVLGEQNSPAQVNILEENAKDLLKDKHIVVSISHEQDYSVAVAIIVNRFQAL